MGISEYFRAETRYKVGLVEFLISYQEATELWEAKWEMDAEGGQASFISSAEFKVSLVSLFS